MKTVHILTDEELAQIKGMSLRIEQLENENKTLREFNLKRRTQYDELLRCYHQLEDDSATKSRIIEEMKRDMEGTKKRLADSQKNLAHTLSVANKRLDIMNSLEQALRKIKNERVCIVVGPTRGRTRVVSVEKVDTFKRFGWGVLTDKFGDSEFIVDRPA